MAAFQNHIAPSISASTSHIRREAPGCGLLTGAGGGGLADVLAISPV